MIPCLIPGDDNSTTPQAKPFILTVAGIGAELSKKNTPYLPSTPEEILEEARAIDIHGTHILHLHVRDKKGRPTLDPKIIKPLVAQIRDNTDLIVQISTGGSIKDTFKARLGVLVPGVQMASLTLGSVNFGNEIFSNPLPFIEELAKIMLKKKIKPEMEIFDLSFVDTAHLLIQKKLIKPPYHFNIILGGPGWLAATEENLRLIVSRLPQPCTWSASGVGRHQKEMITWGLQQGGHIRTGLEDNIFTQKGILAKGNEELVRISIEIAKQQKRRLATTKEAKKLLSL